MSRESEFLDWVRSQQRVAGDVLLPAGDDLAVMRWNTSDLLLVGVDQVLDGVHFDSTQHTPELIGRKAMNRNLSDCAAMGCLPAAALISVALPIGVGLDYAKRLYDGIRSAGSVFDCPVVGGDTGSWSGKLALSVTILGRSAGVEPIQRRGARVGDGIYVSGPLGGSILGRHLTFEPRVREGRLLAESGAVTSMLDLSDGLSRDLPRLLAGAAVKASLGAVLIADQIPVHPDAQNDRGDGRSPLQHALHDGEDYELLFTATEQPPLGIRIGTVNTGEILLEDRNLGLKPLSPLGWDHTL